MTNKSTLKAEIQLLTAAQVAEQLQLHERTVTSWLRQGYLRGFKLGKEWRVSREDLRSFIERSVNRPPDDARLAGISRMVPPARRQG